MPKMPDGASWGIANDFRSVLQLFKKLELGPYRPEPFSIGAFIEKYKTEVFLALVLLLGVLFHIYRSNSLVFQRTAELREAIDQRDRVAEVARNSLKRLSQMEKRGILSQLSHMFAHELKQPLSTVVNYANGLKMYGEQKTLDPIVSQGIDAIASESSKAAQIVDRVREYAKSSRPVDSQSYDGLIASNAQSHRHFPTLCLDTVPFANRLAAKSRDQWRSV
ncbi:MAG: histidine kinase dimerization/phospho-acceptor domain-containing protein [Parasutterella excrementihominis]